MTIKEIIDKINDGKYDEVSKEDLIVLAKASRDATDGKGLDSEKLAEEMKAAFDEFRNSPAGQEKLKRTLIDNRSQRFTTQYAPFFKAMLAGTDIATSLNQINIAQRSFNRLVRPSIPPPPGVDPRLDYALRQSEQGTMAAPQAANVAKADIFDQYLQDIRNAGTAGGGQQSTFGALAQTASERRNRALTRLIPLTNDVQMQREAMHNQLLQERGRQTQYNYNNRLEAAGMEFNQYNQEAKVAGALGAQGRLNLRQTLGGISDLAPQLASRMYPVSNPYKTRDSNNTPPTSTQAGVYHPKYDEYSQILDNSIANKIAMQNYPRITPHIAGRARPTYEMMNSNFNTPELGGEEDFAYNDQVRY